jgi:hypothetical protein
VGLVTTSGRPKAINAAKINGNLRYSVGFIKTLISPIYDFAAGEIITSRT